MTALPIGPPELSAVIILALIVVAASSVGNLMKGLVMACLGVMLAMFGQDPVGLYSALHFRHQ
jgi:putative tricarboxylic transport membrane protein